MRRTPRILLDACAAIPALLLAAPLGAGPIVVFGAEDFYVLDVMPAPEGPADPAEHAFFEAYKQDQSLPYEKAMDLTNPPSWGKTVSASTHGTVQYHPSLAAGFACRISVDGLAPDHDYFLTLSGNPELPGNDLLLSQVPGTTKERYYDFHVVRTDGRGHFDGSYGIYLKPGKYEARCSVKDTSDSKVVLYHEYFPFDVR